MNWFAEILSTWPVWMIGLSLFASMCLFAFLGRLLRDRIKPKDSDDKEGDGPESYIFSAVAGLLALLLGFTFSMAVDRFDARRALVLEEANVISMTYLRAQLLPEPHRARVSNLVERYVENRVILGSAQTVEQARAPLATSNALIVDLWTATVSAWPSIRGYDFSSAFIDSMNSLIDLDAKRKTARNAHVPPAIFAVLFIYMVVVAGVLGYVIVGKGDRFAAAALMALFTLSLMLIVDIDQPAGGRIRENQTPMVTARDFILSKPPSSFDRWSTPEPAATPAR